ncbi:efflux RND transporter permease subunit [Stratiformator vulcanicus]|uniref:MMPL family protein n=1 Tax=Stratiformator vulcanicus TaxID=2527980 RepID=A0A517R6Y3_9PLAN|nr:MMPL family transporter [Stratiformator vulcanicus]QDT39648.1 MMPL family protein [Stratiformator vulcanicus]
MKATGIAFLIRYRIPLLLVAVIATLLAIRPAMQLDFDRTIESLYAPDNPRLLEFQKSRRLFGGDEFVVVAWEQDDALSDESLEQISRFSDTLSQVPGIEPESTQNISDTLTLKNFDSAIGSSFGPFQVFARRAAQITMRKRLIALSRGLLIGEDDRTVAVVLRLKSADDATVDRAVTYRRIRELAAEHDPKAYVAGEPIQVYDAFRYVEEDGFNLFLVSFVLLGVGLLILFQNLRWVTLPLLIVVASVLWTRGLLVLAGARLSMVSSMLNALLTIIGVAAVAHIAVRFRAERVNHSAQAALYRTLRVLGGPIFWAAATTAIGFLSLTVSNITPVRSFGLMMALGTGLVLLATALYTPGTILLAKKWVDLKSPPAEGALIATLLLTARTVRRFPLMIGAGTAVLIIASVAGMFRLNVETDFSKNFREDSPVIVALNFIEDRLGGAGSWEVNFEAPDELTKDYLDRTRDLSQRLKSLTIEGNEEPLTNVVSLTDGLDLIPPIISSDLPEGNLKLLSGLQPELVPSLYNREAGRMRIILRSAERTQSSEKKRIIDAVAQEARQVFPDAKVSGIYVLLTFLIESLLADQFLSFGVAACGVIAMTGIALRSVSLAILSIVPNVFPIAIVLGGMGWLGLTINLGTAMIASVSIGLTIDSSIHYLTGFQSARRRGCSVAEAILETHSSTGRALVFATLALAVGFSVLSLSHFIPLVYFGLLTSLALIGGLAGNLILLPMLLTLRYPQSAIVSEPVPPTAPEPQVIAE